VKPHLLLVLVVGLLVACGTPAGGPTPEPQTTPIADATPTEPVPEPGFNPDDPALDTLAASDAARRRLLARIGHRADFRVPRSVVAGLDLGPLVVAVVSRPFIELSGDDPRLRRLNPGQRAVHAIYVADFEILNGGFEQLWDNSSGAIAEDLVGAATLVGSDDFTDIFRDAQALWPGDRIPRNRAERQRFLPQIPEDAVAALDERYAQTQYRRRTALAIVLGGYIRQHPSQFIVG
jgi:hypothetical protein